MKLKEKKEWSKVWLSFSSKFKAASNKKADDVWIPRRPVRSHPPPPLESPTSICNDGLLFSLYHHHRLKSKIELSGHD
jgi:hypothetical protein